MSFFDEKEDDTKVEVPDPRRRAVEYVRTLRVGSIIPDKDLKTLDDASVHVLELLRRRGLSVIDEVEGWRVRKTL